MVRPRRTLVHLVLAALAWLPLPAQADPAQAGPALWKVADADTTIYLFGTIHALPPGIDWLDQRIAAALDSADTLVTEIPDDDPAQLQALLIASAALPPGQSLRALLAPTERAKFEAALASLQLPGDSFDRFEPWYAAVSLSTLPLLRQGFASGNGAEAVLEARARQHQRPHQALETAAYQLGLFDTLPLDLQRRYLAETMRQLPTIAAQGGEMVTAWQAGDPERLAALINAGEDEPELVERLLTNRNRAWAKWIAARLARPGTVFVAVGAGHLAGPGSVQAQLRARGIASERVQ